ncbi:MAG: phage integrase family protein, partial [Burkholderiaceae bacterium]
RTGRASRPSQRARVISRQLEALRWLESHVAQDPRPADSVATWLNPAAAAMLQRSGLTTLSEVATAINAHGARWWRQVPGIGPLKAERIVSWLRAQEAVTGLRLRPSALVPRSSLSAADLHQVVPPGAGLLPLEKLRVPEALDGRHGTFRAPRERCRLVAEQDVEAIQAWLAAKGRVPAPGQRAAVLSATQRSYRKEAERLMLWCVLIRHQALSSLNAGDAVAFLDFLCDPPAAWCGPRHEQRWSPAWRPLEGPLSAAARGHAATVLRSLFAFLTAQGYLTRNAFSGSAAGDAACSAAAPGRRPLDARRALTPVQWQTVDAGLGVLPDTEPARRLARALRWLHATGMRRHELVSARCGDLRCAEIVDTQERVALQWSIRIHGTGGRHREVRLPPALIDEYQAELLRQGRGDVRLAGNQAVPVLACFGVLGNAPRPWSASALAKAIRTVLLQIGAEAGHGAALSRASAHWLRHAYALAALDDTGGTEPVALRDLQVRMGHASKSTTATYLGKAEASAIRNASV